MNALASRLVAALAYPRSLDDVVALALPTYSSTEVRARVVDVRRETHDVATLRLRPNARWDGHRAGQHVALTVEIGGVRRTRCFSIASAEPRDDGDRTIALTVKARPSGVVTPALVSGALRGAIVTLSQASGDFVLPDVPPNRLLFVSGGSGITPVMSMLRTLVRRGHTGEVVFVHYARSQADVIFREELERLGAPNVRVHVRLGCYEAADLEAHVPGFASYETWACGPEPFLEAVRDSFAARGAAHRVRVERFSLAKTDSADAGSVTFVRSRRRAESAQRRGSTPILQMAEGAGLAPPSGCRRGICRTCMCRKVSGVTRDLRTGELSTDADVDIQICVSAPVGPVEIDI